MWINLEWLKFIRINFYGHALPDQVDGKDDAQTAPFAEQYSAGAGERPSCDADFASSHQVRVGLEFTERQLLLKQVDLRVRNGQCRAPCTHEREQPRDFQ